MRKRLFISFIIVLFIGISVTGIFSLQLTKDFYLNSLEEKLTSNGQLLAGLFSNEYNTDRSNYDDLAKYFSSLSDSRVTIISKDGTVIGESDMKSLNMENHSERQEVREALEGKIGKSYRYSNTEKMNRLYIAIPVKDSLSYGMVIRLSVPLTEIHKIEQHILIYIIIAALSGLVISSLIAYKMVRKITRPINEMTYMSSMIADGRYDKRINLNAGDEIGQLASAFNNMAAKLEIVVSDLADKKNKLEAILKSMDSGVIAVDTSGIIMLANPAAYDMFGFKDEIIGRHMLDVFVNAELEDIIRNHPDETREFKISYPQKRILRVKAALINDDGSGKSFGVVVVMQDITEIRQLEKMRSDFVANVSHELKTPLTSIKGFAETLKNGAAEDEKIRNKFLDIINVEADRLSRLINDIMAISELENKKNDTLFESIDVNKAAEEIEEMMKNLAALKNIEVEFILDKDSPHVIGNFDRIKQLMINLIDNAIKYTPEGGKVSSKLFHDEKNVFIEVSDTGIGIPKEHISRLFERFYRVDKSRSRALGGTGLGLAIVKHIVLSMKGDIEVESTVGKGSTFKVSLPVENSLRG